MSGFVLLSVVWACCCLKEFVGIPSRMGLFFGFMVRWLYFAVDDDRGKCWFQLCALVVDCGRISG